MYLTGARAQQVSDHFKFDASGTITTGGTPQLLLPVAKSRAMLLIVNMSTTETMYVDFGGARATAAITNGVVTSITITNAGFGYTYAPDVLFVGGGNSGVGGVLGVGQWGYPSPGDPAWSGPAGRGHIDLSTQRPAKGLAVLSGNTIGSVTILDGGAGYNIAPQVLLINKLNDPFGAANPGQNSGASFWGAIPIGVLGSYYVNGTACPTDQVSGYAATTGHPFTVKWMP